MDLLSRRIYIAEKIVGRFVIAEDLYRGEDCGWICYPRESKANKQEGQLCVCGDRIRLGERLRERVYFTPETCVSSIGADSISSVSSSRRGRDYQRTYVRTYVRINCSFVVRQFSRIAKSRTYMAR